MNGGQPRCFDPESSDEKFAHDGYVNVSLAIFCLLTSQFVFPPSPQAVAQVPTGPSFLWHSDFMILIATLNLHATVLPGITCSSFLLRHGKSVWWAYSTFHSLVLFELKIVAFCAAGIKSLKTQFQEIAATSCMHMRWFYVIPSQKR